MAALERLMQEQSAYLVDIRLSARSRMSAFNQASLQTRFGKRSIPMPELGSINYRPQDRHQGIKIASPDRGIQRLINGLSQGYSIVLMCGCNQYALCLRHTVVDLLLLALPTALVEFPDKQQEVKQ